MTGLSPDARNISWLVSSFVQRVPGVAHAIVVSSDGLPMAVSEGLDREAADRFAAVASGLFGLANGVAGPFGGGAVHEIIIEMERAFLFVTGISDGSCLAVVAQAGCDVGLVGYEMAVLVERAGPVLTPRSGRAPGGPSGVNDRVLADLAGDGDAPPRGDLASLRALRCRSTSRARRPRRAVGSRGRTPARRRALGAGPTYDRAARPEHRRARHNVGVRHRERGPRRLRAGRGAGQPGCHFGACS